MNPANAASASVDAIKEKMARSFLTMPSLHERPGRVLDTFVLNDDDLGDKVTFLRAFQYPGVGCPAKLDVVDPVPAEILPRLEDEHLDPDEFVVVRMPNDRHSFDRSVSAFLKLDPFFTSRISYSRVKQFLDDEIERCKAVFSRREKEQRAHRLKPYTALEKRMIVAAQLFRYVHFLACERVQVCDVRL